MELLRRSRNGSVLPKNATREVAAMFLLHIRTVQRFWAEGKRSRTDGNAVSSAQQDGFDIRLICQPANSPDFNILDLGFFRAIQSIQYKKTAKTIQDLIPVVQEVCDLPFSTINLFINSVH